MYPVSSRGLWSPFERTFFDVCVIHPNAPSYQKSDIDKLYRKHETKKMVKYNGLSIGWSRSVILQVILPYPPHEKMDTFYDFTKQLRALRNIAKRTASTQEAKTKAKYKQR